MTCCFNCDSEKISLLYCFTDMIIVIQCSLSLLSCTEGGREGRREGGEERERERERERWADMAGLNARGLSTENQSSNRIEPTAQSVCRIMSMTQTSTVAARGPCT